MDAIMNHHLWTVSRTALPFATALVLIACGKRDDWYEYSTDVDRWKQDRIEAFMREGMSKEEASGAFNAEHAIWETETGGQWQDAPTPETKLKP